MKHFLIFTDLDGTLLDHKSYQWDQAKPALGRIKAEGIPLILSTSKTAAELFSLRQQLGNQDPFIVENGGVLGFSTNYFRSNPEAITQSFQMIRFTQNYDEIVAILNQIRVESGYRFRGFNDMDALELSQITGLPLGDAKRAKQRESTEPLLWLDRVELMDSFKATLTEYGLGLTQGGRFYHVSGAIDKSEGVNWLIKKFNLSWPERQFVSVALGDGANDIKMLEAVDIPVVVKSASGSTIDIETDKPVIFTEEPGPAGWCKAMERILKEETNG